MIIRRYLIAGLLFACLIVPFHPLHAQGLRGGAPATTGRSAPAAQESTVQDRVSAELAEKYGRMAEVLEQPAPQRHFTVATSELPIKTKLFRADPKLLEKKYLATFLLVTFEQDNSPTATQFSADEIRRADSRLTGRGGSMGNLPPYPADLLRLLTWNGRHLILFNSFDGDANPMSLSEQNKLLLEKCATENRPSPLMAGFLTSPDCDRDVDRNPHGPPGSREALGWTYRVFAATPEEAQEKAAAILELLDGGFSWPMRRYLFGEGRKSLEAARPIFEEVAKLNTAIKAEEEKLAKPSEISPEILSQLKAQKVMVAVELAGLIARVKACDEMLKDPKKLEISTLQSISDMKVKAEIERVGIKEKLDQINTFIGEGDGRQATQEQIAELKKSRTPVWGRARSTEAAARTYAGLFDLYAPLPLKDNQITINPVEWTN